MPRILLLENLNLEKQNLKKVRKDYSSLLKTLQFTRKKQELMRKVLKKKNFLIESLRKAQKAEREVEMGNERNSRSFKRRRYGKSVQKCFFGVLTNCIRLDVVVCKAEDILVCLNLNKYLGAERIGARS